MLRASLLPLLGGRGILLGRCCRSWMAGVMSPSGLRVALHGVDVVVKWTWIVAGGVSRLWEASLAWWLLVEEDMSQGCDFGITFNTHVKSRNLWDVVSTLYTPPPVLVDSWFIPKIPKES